MFPTRLPRLVAAVDTAIPWPSSIVALTFEGREVRLCPEDDTSPDRIEMQYPARESYRDAIRVLNRFMSALAWVQGKALRAAQIMGFGRPEDGMGKGVAKFNSNGLVVRADTLIIDYLPEPADPEQRLALAFYREALNCNSIPYQFLGFIKIINIRFGPGNQQKNWIRQTVPQLTDHEARRRLGEITDEIGEYLYAQGRCAVAHAHEGTIVNPDEVDDEQRLALDVPVVKSLAEHFIEHTLGLPSQGTIWDEHLYELEGFRAFLGPDLVARLKAREELGPEHLPVLPPLGLRLRDGDELPSLVDLQPLCLMPVNGSLCMILGNGHHPVQVSLALDFPQERLAFDPARLVVVNDDGSEAAAQSRQDRAALLGGLLRNGQLHVVRTDTGERMGRTDAFLPDDIQYREMQGLVDMEVHQ